MGALSATFCTHIKMRGFSLYRLDSYNNIGLVDYEKGDYENALVEYHKALEIQLKIDDYLY
jgi:hypothetical protein|eukprot:scaffold3140_cov231-Chaetoceros_neogracile.AAC.5